MKRTLTLTVMIALLAAACGHAGPRGLVDGTFRLPGLPAADLQRGGLNFRSAKGGTGHGHVTQVGTDGSYTVTLSPGSYSVIGALSGQPGKVVPETCGATMRVVVTANHTTRADYVCHATPVTSPTSADRSTP